ncbi:MAG TPA: phage Gp37/Gp68 family protein [Bryobacteraceae bacterium]|jgi:protein gp37|nr:phage Gp37/Gp68 family protein [Bryobacteraceae bacterium]
MSEYSKIEWTEATWNPVRGCLKISPGCKHCYAETFAERFRGVPGHPYEHGFDPRLVPNKLLEPLLWASPKTVFVNSMSDLFQDAVPDEYVAVVAEVMLCTPWHTYQVLTKRADRLQRLLTGELRAAAEAPNIWWGVSVEDKRYGLARITYLRNSPARTRFLSVEPLLEDLGAIDLSGIHWVIVGGESGAGARPMKREWVEIIRKHSRAANASFFFKQWGGARKGRHGRTLNGRTYDEMPARTVMPVPSRARRQELARSLEPLTQRWIIAPIVRIDQRVVA